MASFYLLVTKSAWELMQQSTSPLLRTMLVIKNSAKTLHQTTVPTASGAALLLFSVQPANAMAERYGLVGDWYVLGTFYSSLQQ